MSPTIITDLTPNSRCMVEEIFGPVVGIVRFMEEEEVVEYCNGVCVFVCVCIEERERERMMVGREKFDNANSCLKFCRLHVGVHVGREW